ncbi:5676_t:CDS:2, partial [Paraglomus brasilianum]
DDQNYLAVGVDSNPITNQGTTLYDIVTSDARFSILAGFINDDDELKETLSDEDAALTFFAPIDKALECLKDKKIPKEVIRRIFRYHIVNAALPYKSLLASRVLDTGLNSSGLNDAPQKVRVSGWIRRTYINWSKIKIYHLAAGNGYAYGIDHVLIPPPDIMTELFIIPTFFSTLTSALQKVGLAETLETSKAITVFIPSNRAWAKLGFRNLAYLFSPHGKDALTTILKYHISPELAYSTDLIEGKELFGGIPGKRHTELDTLAGLKLQIDASSYGHNYVKITVNGVRVLFKDFIAKNGVGHTIARVLLPPTTDLYLPDDDYQTIKDGSELMAEIDINEENEKLLELKRKSEKHESKTELDVTRGPV